MPNYAVGDIQGCFKELLGLLNLINFNPKKDKLWLVGDLVNRGPNSLEVLEFIYSIKESCNVVLGNHDIHLLSIAGGLRSPNKEDTLREVLESPRLPFYVDWLRSLGLVYQENIDTNSGERKFIMTHAGIPPHWTKEELERNSKEINNVMNNDTKYKNYLINLYGDLPSKTYPNITIDEELRLNTNYLTRMRYCKSDGELDFVMGKAKGVKEKKKGDFKPWFLHPLNLNISNFHIIFGHWAALGGITGISNITAMDTGCVWGQKLSAFRLEDKRLFSYDRLN